VGDLRQVSVAGTRQVFGRIGVADQAPPGRRGQPGVDDQSLVAGDRSPCPPQFGTPAVTNIRNTASPSGAGLARQSGVCAGDFVLRMGGYQAPEDADLVCPGQEPAVILLCPQLPASGRLGRVRRVRRLIL